MQYLLDYAQLIDVAVKIMQGLASCFVIIGVIIACFQLKNGTRNNKINALKTEFDTFSKISEIEKNFVDCVIELKPKEELGLKLDEKEYNQMSKKREEYCESPPLKEVVAS